MNEPVNVLKYCPRCGHSSFVPHDEKSFKCTDCRFHYFVNSASAVAALIFNCEGELLLTRRAFDPNKGMLDLPGGFVDPGERAEDAVRREVLEELGLTVGSIRYVESWPNRYLFSDFVVYTVDMGFVCMVDDFSGITARDDISDFVFLKPESVARESICSDSIWRLIQAVRA